MSSPTPSQQTNAAYEHNGQPCTREQFYAIACDPRRSVAVEACAGAGKTWMLVSRILRALMDEAEPQDILAITFTKKAAGEMRQRLQQWASEFARPHAGESHEAHLARLQTELQDRGMSLQQALEKREVLQKIYPALLAVGRSVQIRTFHSWFAALLRGAPLQVLQSLGLPSSYELLEDDEDAVAEVWRRYLRRVAGDAALTADYAALVGELGRHNAHQALTAALGKRVEFTLADEAGRVDDAVPDFDTYYPRLTGVAEPFDWLLQRAAGRELLQRAADALAAYSAVTFAACGAQIKQALASGDKAVLQAALLTQKGESRKFNDKLPGIEHVRAAQDEVHALLQAEHQHQAHQHHQRMARLTRALVQAFAQLKRERGWVDMGDIERAALTLLSDPFLSGWVQERLDARVRHLLIDEFQDTNPLQWQALHAWLSAYAGAGGGQAPSVFIVGDPKQSIYRFRRAEPRVFAAAQDFVVQALGGERLACDHTRRNTPAVLGAVNTVMQAAQAAGEFSGFRAHTTESQDLGQIAKLPLIPRPGKADKAPATETVWRDSLCEPREELEDSLRTLECRQAARWLAERVAAGVPPAQLMVLARKRLPLGELQTELRALGLPAVQPEQQVLGELPAVQDLLALVDALVSPGQNLALARALKSPLFGLSDEDLTRIAQAVRAQTSASGGDAPSWLQVLPQVELVTNDAQALHQNLMQMQRSLLSLPPHDALQAIYTRHDVLARFAVATPAPEREHVLQQLRALLGAALQVQGGRFLTAYQWVRSLRRQRLFAPRAANAQAVQLLTVHGAKGLEADEVLLLDSASAPPMDKGAGVLIDWPGDAAAPERLAFVSSTKKPPPSLQDLADQEALAKTREELNTLYVAMTRARRRLVLSGFAPHQKGAASWWQRLEEEAEALPAPPDRAPAHAEHGRFTLRELPPVPTQNEATAAPAQTPTETPAPTAASRLGEAMHWLLEHASDSPAGWLPSRLAQAERRFDLAAGQAQEAEVLARRILQGEAAWAWQAGEGGQVLQAFNEVELNHQGQRLRIDRLVLRRAGAHGDQAWWVLDYKSAAHPERDADLLAQLERYRQAVQQLQGGQPVRAAFINGQGRLLEPGAGRA